MKPFQNARSTPRRRARGMTLIELMVAMMVMTVGIVGLVTLMARASQTSSATEDNLRASLLASDMVNAMWLANSPNVDSAAWSARVADASQSGLQNAAGAVAVAADRTATITITWTTPTGAARRYTTDVRLN
ncbi:prepilin-type N-terminal cleavage/methylation domain-containing protein [Mitsuaria sp. GD03876]|uniref:type IV pilus modification PilV family protein n=1 Tax=Mitsuaria sp. GD03876 TaxID=2975399 RepID=UPI002448173C|nr:prepilin-type N-terminal cleavage/methylation domain-containing protein [Mitsuaria sp. GD03876]MDH0864217.1 prepilin-type N-terminal cleavage/methylation domain-containing protein [Mitsuaria sp. GD03876]